MTKQVLSHVVVVIFAGALAMGSAIQVDNLESRVIKLEERLIATNLRIIAVQDQLATAQAQSNRTQHQLYETQKQFSIMLQDQINFKRIVLSRYK